MRPVREVPNAAGRKRRIRALQKTDTDYILGTFPITRKNEERDFGEFRTRRVVLEEYERMARAAGSQ